MIATWSVTFLKASISRCLYFYDLIYAISEDAGDALVPASACLCICSIINLSEATVYFIFVRQMCCCAWRHASEEGWAVQEGV